MLVSPVGLAIGLCYIYDYVCLGQLQVMRTSDRQRERERADDEIETGKQSIWCKVTVIAREREHLSDGIHLHTRVPSLEQMKITTLRRGNTYQLSDIMDYVMHYTYLALSRYTFTQTHKTSEDIASSTEDGNKSSAQKYKCNSIVSNDWHLAAVALQAEV